MIFMPEAQEDEAPYLSMSNGLTSVFLDVLVLSGSRIANTDREKELVIWLAQRDQSVVGIGTVGFGLEEMPWTADNFANEKAFMRRTIQGAMNESGWEKLSYTPNKEMVVGRLADFQLMIDALQAEYLDPSYYIEWAEVDEDDDSPTIPRGYPMCSKHAVYLSCHGCLLCNDEGGGSRLSEYNNAHNEAARHG
ncbi:hypothetical protein [Paenibacillus elgii]|uniref:hypothetical protein n=1 Tax=Paenibacillus elgii TaxID=189691 RepID=UPI001ED92432|nr:hypothetical protein [Paenibacillus elgii]